MTGSVQGMRDACNDLDKSNQGYDQNQRWTFYNGSDIIKNQECDCSSVCGGIAELGGYNPDLADPFYTGNFSEKMKAAGFSVYDYTDLDDLRDGDFVNAPGSHVEFVYEGGSGGRMWSARSDEDGSATGGSDGDQTGKETGFKDSFNRSGGWDHIVRPPADAPVDVQFRFGQANLYAERFGGMDDDSPARGEYLADELGCSIYALSEVSETARYAIRDAMGGQDRWKLFEVGYVCVMWDTGKWEYHDTDTISFGTDFHGAVRAELSSYTSGEKLDVIAIHVRPNDALSGDDDDKLDQKLGDIRKGLELVRAGVPTAYAGDFNTSHAQDVVLPAGFIRATPHEDTLDKEGSQKLDAVFITPDLMARDYSKHDGGSVTDHKTWVYNGTLIAED